DGINIKLVINIVINHTTTIITNPIYISFTAADDPTKISLIKTTYKNTIKANIFENNNVINWNFLKFVFCFTTLNSFWFFNPKIKGKIQNKILFFVPEIYFTEKNIWYIKVKMEIKPTVGRINKEEIKVNLPGGCGSIFANMSRKTSK
ncbi:hypothetical protein, partial [Mesomycoplasma hyorhinis]|uniref:hypothetical protein n=1 Tax=Mesomycoplasma hyorhinis TaxID=2100 RepID=UPI001C05B634